VRKVLVELLEHQEIQVQIDAADALLSMNHPSLKTTWEHLHARASQAENQNESKELAELAHQALQCF
jgi:hypothetical protein